MSMSSLSESFPLPTISKYPINKSNGKFINNRLPKVNLGASTSIIIYSNNTNSNSRTIPKTSHAMRSRVNMYSLDPVSSSPRINEERIKTMRNEARQSPILRNRPKFVNSFSDILDKNSSKDLENLLPGMANQSTQTSYEFESLQYQDLKDYRVWMNDVVEPFFKDFKKTVLKDKPENLIEYCTAYCLAKANNSELPAVIETNNKNSNQLETEKKLNTVNSTNSLIKRLPDIK